MKKLLLIVLLICFCFSLTSAAIQNVNCLILDPITNRVQTVSNNKIADSFKPGDRPEELLRLANGNYALLCTGTKTMFDQPKGNASAIILNSNLKTTGAKIDFPGNIIKKIHDEKTDNWYFLTRDKNNNSALVAVDFSNNTSKTVVLPSPSIADLLHEQKLYIACFGNPTSGLSAELIAVDLNNLQTVSYPLPAAPGAIFAIDNDRLAIACGGIDTESTEISGSGAPKNGYFNRLAGFLGFETTSEPTENTTVKTKIKAEKAGLFILNTVDKQTQKFDVGTAPLIVLQSEKNPQTFYLSAANSSMSGDIRAWAYKFEDNKLIKLADLKAAPSTGVLDSQENLVLYSKNDLIVINSHESKITYTAEFSTSIERLALSSDKKYAYTATRNSNFLDIIDLVAGKSISRLKLGKGSLLGSSVIPDFFNNNYSAVVAPQQNVETAPLGATVPQRFCFNNDKTLLYALSNSNEVAIISTADNTVKNVIKFLGTPYGISATNDGKKIIVATQSDWYLLDPNQTKELCRIRLSGGDKSEGDILAPKSAFLSPEGESLLIPYSGAMHVVDLETNKELKSFRTASEAPIVVWP